MISIWELANSQLRGLAVYEPGKRIEQTARELGAFLSRRKLVEGHPRLGVAGE